MRIGWMWMVPACLAQTPAPPAPLAAISGVVINDVTGVPVRRAVVILSTLDETPLEALTFSESNGAFGFTRIPPGKYQLRVDLDGFQQAWFGARTSNRPPATLRLAAGDVRSGITFRLRPLGVISGVVLDPEGDPLPNVPVRLLKSVWERLKPAYSSDMWTNTDDRGRYRFQDVVPGQYVIATTQYFVPALLTQPDVAASQSAQPHKMYAAQFYPDAGRLTAAEPVKLAGAQELEGIDFHLAARAVAMLRGKIAVPPDMPANQGVQIHAFPQDAAESGYESGGAAAAPPDYTFELQGLIAGPYVIAASFTDDGHEYRAVERIELSAGGMELTLRPERAIDLSGRVDLEGAGAAAAGPFQVSLIPGGYPPGRNPIEAEVRPDGTFTASNVVPGIWDINVTPVPPGGCIKAMRLGEQDVLAEDMTIGPGTHESLHLVVSTHGAVVAGTVTVPPGVARLPRASVLLAPYGKYAQVLSFYAQAAADDAGHFEIKGVTPGRYKLYAFEELDPTAYQDPGFLKPFEKLSAAFDVAEGERVERETQLILTGTEGGAGN